MRFGVYLGPIFSGDMPGEQAYELALDMARAARDAGFDGIHAAHHYLMGPSHQTLHPLVLLARVAAECPGMHLATSVYLLPLDHPVPFAEATALLDVLCGGRLIVGVGSAYRAVEFQSLGIPKPTRAKRLSEAVAALRVLWAEDGATFEGDLFRFRDATIRPKPVQRPGPPIWVGADTIPGVRLAAAVGDAWLASGRHSKTFLRAALPVYKARRDELGRPFEGLPMFREMHVAPTSHQAVAQMREALERLYHDYARWGQPGERYDQDFEALRRERILVGSPREVAEEVMRYRDEFQVPYMFFRVYWPGMETAQAVDAIRLFGQEVIPLLR